MFRGKQLMLDQPKPFDVTTLESEIAEEFRNGHARSLVPQAEFAVKPAEQVSRLTSEAVMTQHQQAADAIAKLGETIKALSLEHESALTELDAMSRLIVTAAEKYIALGQQRSELIARSAKIMADVKQTCHDVMSRIDD